MSNIVEGRWQSIIGSDRKFSIRLKKYIYRRQTLRLMQTHIQPMASCAMWFIWGCTRFLVELKDGGDLVVVSQNLKTTSMDAAKVKGSSVRLVWKCEHVRPLGS
ncbi:MAG: hypothetical protein U0V48_19155 [Anaerolineales bacterium]